MHIALSSAAWPEPIAYRIDAGCLLPDDLRLWIRRVVASPLPTGARFEIDAEREVATETGWPLRLVEARVVQDGIVREVRIAALYAFFEHGASVVVTAADAAAIEPHRASIERWLASARPVFSGDVVSLSELWDIDGGPPVPADATQRASIEERSELEAGLHRAAAVDTLDAQLAQAMSLVELGRVDEALAQCEGTPAAGWLRGTVLASLGRLDEARAAWRAAIASNPRDVASHYNLGLLELYRGEFAAARALWRDAARLAPDDLAISCKLVEAEHRLEAWDAAAASRAELRRRWHASSEPRARFLTEAVIDQFEAHGLHVVVYETFRPSDPSFHPVFRFVVVDPRGSETGQSVVVETSADSEPGSAPFILVVRGRGADRLVGMASELPPYPTLRATARALLGELAERGGGQSAQ